MTRGTGREARAQGASICGHIGATEDAASRRVTPVRRHGSFSGQAPRGRGRLRACVLLFALLVGACGPSGLARAAGGTLAARLDRALTVSGVDPSRTGALVVDLASGEPVYVHNADTALAPA